jgi:hypothetical protein
MVVARRPDRLYLAARSYLIAQVNFYDLPKRKRDRKQAAYKLAEMGMENEIIFSRIPA